MTKIVVTLVSMMLEMLSDYCETIPISNLAIVVALGYSTNMLSQDVNIHLPTNFVE